MLPLQGRYPVQASSQNIRESMTKIGNFQVVDNWKLKVSLTLFNFLLHRVIGPVELRPVLVRTLVLSLVVGVEVALATAVIVIQNWYKVGICLDLWNHIGGLVQERRNSIANALGLRLSCTNPSIYHVDELVQERCNSIANALELRLSCTNPSIYHVDELVQERCNSIANALELRLSCTNPSIYPRNTMLPATMLISCCVLSVTHCLSK